MLLQETAVPKNRSVVTLQDLKPTPPPVKLSIHLGFLKWRDLIGPLFGQKVGLLGPEASLDVAPLTLCDLTRCYRGQIRDFGKGGSG